MRTGISTHLYHDQQLTRDHLAEIADHGFEAVELFATRSHFDYHDPAAIDRLAEWLRETRLALHGIHAPITDSFKDGQWGHAFSTASADSAARDAAVREAKAALEVARRIPASFLVVHLGVPASLKSAGDNNREAARRSVEELFPSVEALGLRMALEVIPSELSAPASLVRLLEDDLDLPRVGICLDVGHAFLLGDVVDAIEIVSEHLITTHIHDNHGRSDDHLAPFDGRIEWPSALATLQKIGYDGTMLFELGNTSTPREVLQRAQRARERFEEILMIDSRAGL